jgi:hypothetical protein
MEMHNMIQYHPLSTFSVPSTGFFKTVAKARNGQDSVWFTVHTGTDACQSVAADSSVTKYRNIDEMRNAARVLRDNGWRIARR